MQIGSVARRYSRALFELGRDSGGDATLDRWLDQLEQLSRIFRSSIIYPVLENPAIPFEQKQRMLESSLNNVDPQIRNFIYLIVSKNRAALLDQMTAGLRERIYDARGIATADVRTAIPLTPDQRERLTTRLGSYLNRTIVIQEEVDPAIVGGAVIQVGDKLIDASVLGRLETLHDRMMNLN